MNSRGYFVVEKHVLNGDIYNLRYEKYIVLLSVDINSKVIELVLTMLTFIEEKTDIFFEK